MNRREVLDAAASELDVESPTRLSRRELTTLARNQNGMAHICATSMLTAQLPASDRRGHREHPEAQPLLVDAVINSCLLQKGSRRSPSPLGPHTAVLPPPYVSCVFDTHLVPRHGGQRHHGSTPQCWQAQHRQCHDAD